jgi:CubicO group peptidase (beta-lactamase class C family)
LWWFKGYGFANLEARVPVTEDTPFHLASLTKPFASTLLMGLVEQDKLDFDAPVSEFGIVLESPGTVTVRHLLSHTSRGNPGERYHYDGARFGLLDQVIEQVTGRSFKANVAATVIRPLGLKNTGAMTDELATRLASPYVLDESGRLVPGVYPTYFGTSAGLVSSVSDYAEFIGAIRENQFLTAQTQAVAFTPAKSTSGEDLPYGLGWFVENVSGTKVLWHYGYWDCVSTFVLMVPERNIAFLAFANSDGLSRGFGIGRGSVLRSPVALDFLDVFITESNEQ